MPKFGKRKADNGLNYKLRLATEDKVCIRVFHEALCKKSEYGYIQGVSPVSKIISSLEQYPLNLFFPLLNSI